MTPPDAPKIVIPTVPHDNLKMLTEKHKDEKPAITLLTVGTGLIAYHFWYEINGIIIIHNRWSMH